MFEKAERAGGSKKSPKYIKAAALPATAQRTVLLLLTKGQNNSKQVGLRTCGEPKQPEDDNSSIKTPIKDN